MPTWEHSSQSCGKVVKEKSIFYQGYKIKLDCNKDLNKKARENSSLVI